jgi:hypothetical protein
VSDRRSDKLAGSGRSTPAVQRPRRARRHLLVAALVLGYLAAGGVALALGDRVAGGGWLALHLVLLGAATNAIVVWSEHFATALLRTAPVGEWAATARALALNLGIVAVLAGVPTGRPALAAAGAGLAGVVVLAHALTLAARIARALPARLAGAVWYYVAAAAALLAGMGLGLWLAGGVAGSADAYLALRLAHVHLNVLGWVGLAVVGTQFTLWPTVLRTHMVPGLEAAMRRALPPLAAGLAVAATGLATQQRVVALAGLAAYGAGLAVALVPFVRTARRRPPRTASAWMLGAGMAWLVMAVLADLGALAASAPGGRPRRPAGAAGPGRGRRVRPADPDRGPHLPAAGGVRPGRGRQPPPDRHPRAGLAGPGGGRQPRGARAAGRVGGGVVAGRAGAGQLRAPGRGRASRLQAHPTVTRPVSRPGGRCGPRRPPPGARR